jgi:hypothetical protein
MYRIDSRQQEIINYLPSIYFFEGGEDSNNIRNGGLNLFDGGNYIMFDSFSIRDALPYSESNIRTEERFGRFGRYFTKKVPGLFVFAADF